MLSLANVPHVAGRSFDEAERLIDEQIANGTLPPNIRDLATLPQREVLDRLGIEYPDDISKSDASRLISEQTPPTENQIAFLKGLGYVGDAPATRRAVSELIERLEPSAPMSQGQARFIDQLGGDSRARLSYSAASEFIAYLLELDAAWDIQCKKCGAMNPRREHCVCGAFLRKPSPIPVPSHLRRSPSLAEQARGRPFLERLRAILGLSSARDKKD